MAELADPFGRRQRTLLAVARDPQKTTKVSKRSRACHFEPSLKSRAVEEFAALPGDEAFRPLVDHPLATRIGHADRDVRQAVGEHLVDAEVPRRDHDRTLLIDESPELALTDRG